MPRFHSTRQSLRTPRSSSDAGGPGANDDRLAIARAIEPLLDESREEMDRTCRLPDAAVDALRRSGIARASVPGEYGGPELNPMSQVELVEEFSRVDGSVGWCAMIAAASSYTSGFLGPEAAERWFGAHDAFLAGQIHPTGRAQRVDGGYVVTGRFRFGSGISHATMVLAGCIVEQDGEVVRNDRGRPELRTIIVTPDQVDVVDNWDTSGLRGTGSSDYILTDVFAPEDDTYDPAAAPRHAGPWFRFAPLFLSPHDGVPLGMARRAIDEVTDLAEHKGIPPLGRGEPPRLRDTVQVQEAVARAEVELGGIRAMCYESLTQLWASLLAGEPPTRRQRGLYRAAMVGAHEQARSIVGAMVDVASTSAIHRGSTLERIHRDAAVASQHRVVHTRNFAAAGRLLLGLSAGDPTL